MKRQGQGWFDTRALEFAVLAAAVYLAADPVRSALGPLYKSMSLLLGL
jgi:hypothetical protein